MMAEGVFSLYASRSAGKIEQAEHDEHDEYVVPAYADIVEVVWTCESDGGVVAW
jgi:hypothetical protein